ncbi:hypothetical protein EYF80_000381 [Liparis tanakae]|uniref:Uncharacterized protein n=1 Tax=Liparis tanakae TaxID=230148 RepID=A0A4Z2JGV2_9TELE|nr:hypothetical protein EYF80_000381 [Liparis tanakae]
MSERFSLRLLTWHLGLLASLRANRRSTHTRSEDTKSLGRFSSCSALARSSASFSSSRRWASSRLSCSLAMARASSSLSPLSTASRAIRSSLRTLKEDMRPRNWMDLGLCNVNTGPVICGCVSRHIMNETPDLSFSSCSRRSCSSFSRCSRACRRFSARMRAASSWLLVPAMGLAAGDGDGDDAGAEGAECSGSGEGEAAAAALTVVLEGWAEDTATGLTGSHVRMEAWGRQQGWGRQFYLSVLTGVELRLCWPWVMSGVLDVTLQRSEQRWWGWWAHKCQAPRCRLEGQIDKNTSANDVLNSAELITPQTVVRLEELKPV